MTSTLLKDRMDLVRKHQSSRPVRVVALAHDLGLIVLQNDKWPDDISGQIARNNAGGYTITVNANHSAERKRFTIAHEIAHYILHQDLIGDGIVDDALYRSRLGGRIEVQANELAADILMPWGLINQAMDEGIKGIDHLAKAFDVSKSAMSIRLGVPYEP